MEQNILYIHTRNNTSFSEKKIELKTKTNWRRATEKLWTFSTSVDRKIEAKADAKTDTDAEAEAEAEAESRSDSENEVKGTGHFLFTGTFEKLVTLQPSKRIEIFFVTERAGQSTKISAPAI